MFEFLNYSILIISVMLIFIFTMMFYAEKVQNQNTLFPVFIIVGLLVVNIYLPYNSQMYSQTNISLFEESKELKCTNANFPYSVSINDGWSVDGNYFFKHELMVRSDMCEQQ